MKTVLQTLMQKIMVVFAIILCNISIAQIPNWNMESWTTTTKDIPTQWITYGSISKVTPAQNGLYAIKLQGDYNSGPGAILYGNPGNNNFTGGTPFTARPDSMVAYFKYSIAAGDSAWVLVQMKKNGVVISNDLYTYTGSYTSAFKRMSFKIHYLSGVSPDSMFIGFTSTIPEVNSSSQINTTSWVILDNISFVGTTQNVPNPDFENWTTQSTNLPVGWQADVTPIGNSVVKTTDAYAGNYAMKVQTIIDAQGTLGGYTQTVSGTNNNGSWGPTFPVTSTPNSLKGFYKFIPQNGDTFNINISLFKNGQQVGSGGIFSTATISTYTSFSVPINYNNVPPQAPDSATIQISTYAMTGNNNSPRGQSVAYIDNLSFDQFIYSGIDESKSQISKLMIFPNPAQTNLNVQFNLLQKQKVAISIYNLNGYEVLKLDEQNFNAGNHELNFNVDQLSCGFYFLVTQSGTSISHQKLAIAK